MANNVRSSWFLWLLLSLVLGVILNLAGCFGGPPQIPATEEVDAGNNNTGDEPECARNVDCDDGQVCTDGRCVDGDTNNASGCWHDGQCASGRVCDHGMCVSGDPTPSNNANNNGNNDTDDDCVTTADCKGGEFCDTGECRAVECTSDDDCASDEVCERHLCVLDEDGCEDGVRTVYPDDDGDGEGSTRDARQVCREATIPTGYVLSTGDCDDTRDSVNTDANEVCNNRDDNCDGDEDEGCHECQRDIDCGDLEICDDDQDNDCDGRVDETGCSNASTKTCYRDLDGDTYGDRASTRSVDEDDACPSGYRDRDSDCDDDDDQVNPGEDEVCGDGIDNDCNGLVDGNDLNACEDGGNNSGTDDDSSCGGLPVYLRQVTGDSREELCFCQANFRGADCEIYGVVGDGAGLNGWGGTSIPSDQRMTTEDTRGGHDYICFNFATNPGGGNHALNAVCDDGNDIVYFDNAFCGAEDDEDEIDDLCQTTGDNIFVFRVDESNSSVDPNAPRD